MNKPLFTNIQHVPRLKLGITCNEYCVADIIHWGSYNPKNSSGWCYASKNYIGDCLGISKKSTLEIIERLIKKGLVEKDATSKHLRTTVAWYDALSLWGQEVTKGYQKSGNETPPTGHERLPRNGNETTPNNNKHNKKDKEIREIEFFNKVKEYQNKNRSKYPSAIYKKFFDYWTEESAKDGVDVMRFEAQEFFNIGRRLATFWSLVKPDDRKNMISQDEPEIKNEVPTLFKQID